MLNYWTSLNIELIKNFSNLNAFPINFSDLSVFLIFLTVNFNLDH